MRRNTTLVAALTVVLVLAAAPLMAMSPHQYGPVTMDHTKYGVSQFQAGLGTGYAYYQKVVNPTPVDMIVALLFYDRPSDIGASDGVFSDCAVVRVMPHGVYTTDGPEPAFVEVIAAPEDPVMVNGAMTRMADGMGVYVDMGPYGGGPLYLMNPDHFVLPNGADAKTAWNCVKAGLTAIGADISTFVEFLP